MKRKPNSTAERKRVYEKFGGKCAYCGQPITYKEMQLERLQKRLKGGGA